MKQRRKPLRRLDPDELWNVSTEDTVRQGVETCKQLLQMIDTAPLALWKRAGTFLADVHKAAASMLAAFEKGGVPTDRQLSALRNWSAAVQKRLDSLN